MRDIVLFQRCVLYKGYCTVLGLLTLCDEAGDVSCTGGQCNVSWFTI